MIWAGPQSEGISINKCSAPLGTQGTGEDLMKLIERIPVAKLSANCKAVFFVFNTIYVLVVFELIYSLVTSIFIFMINHKNVYPK